MLTLLCHLLFIKTAINVVVGFAVVYSTPYLLRAISAKTAYIWGACAAVAAVWTWLCLPETKGRTLEELDQVSTRICGYIIDHEDTNIVIILLDLRS